MPGQDGTGPLGTGPCGKGGRVCRWKLSPGDKEKSGKRTKADRQGHGR